MTLSLREGGGVRGGPKAGGASPQQQSLQAQGLGVSLLSLSVPLHVRRQELFIALFVQCISHASMGGSPCITHTMYGSSM